MTIPVLIAPAYNRHDLLLRMLRSIDVPVERGLVIDSGMNIEESKEWPELLDEMERLNLFPFSPPFSSMGYGGAINFTILQTANAPWWVWASNDVEFRPGHLETVAQRMEGVRTPKVITGAFTWAAINRATIDTVGLVDEHSFFPIYFDDNDYARRCALAGVEWVEDGAARHGDDRHEASLTILSDNNAREANNRTFGLNQDAYVAKWGGRPGDERFDTPWNEGHPMWVTRPSSDGRRDRQW